MYIEGSQEKARRSSPGVILPGRFWDRISFSLLFSQGRDARPKGKEWAACRACEPAWEACNLAWYNTRHHIQDNPMLSDPQSSSRRSCLVYQWYVPGFHFGWRLWQDFFLFLFPPFLPRGLFTFQDITMGQSSKVLRKAKIRKLTTSLTSSSTCKYKTVYFLTTRPPGRAADRPNINENEPVKRPWLGYLLKEPLKIRQTVPTPDSLENRWQWSIFPALWGHVFWSRKSTLCLAPCKKWAKKKNFHYPLSQPFSMTDQLLNRKWKARVRRDANESSLLR